MYQKVSTIIFFTLFAFFVRAQDRLWFDELNIKDGLSQSTILCLLQDQKGFIWVGTQYGLNRFDGYQFESFYNEKGNSASLSSNYIVTMYEDKSGLLWIGTNNGLNTYDKSTNSFKRFLFNPNDNTSINNNYISAITEDQLGNIWIGTIGGGLNRFNKKSQIFESNILKLDKNTANFPESITHILLDSEGKLWVTTGSIRLIPSTEKGYIYTIDPQTLIISLVKPLVNNQIIETESITSVFQDNMKNIWFGTLGNGLLKKNYNSHKFSHYYQSEISQSNSITAITQDYSGRIWFSTQYAGIYEFNPTDQELTNYNTKNTEISNLNDDDVVSLLIDTTGVFWVGTWTEGIKKLDFDTFQFQKYLQVGSENHAANQDILDINQDSLGNTWLAAWESGLLKLDLKSGKTMAPEILQTGVAGLVRHIFVDKNDKLWLGSNDKGLIYYDPTNNRVKAYQYNKNNPYSINTNKVIYITDEPSGNLWIATRGGGLNYFDIKEEKFYHYVHRQNDKNSLINDRISALYYDENDHLWIGTNDGLDIFNTKSKSFVAHYNENNKSIIGKEINVIFYDRNKRMWIGTDKGVLKVNETLKDNYEKLTFTSIYGTDNTLFGSVGGILDDIDGNLWVSGIKYIAQYNPQTNNFKNYYYSSGVLVGGYYIGSSHQSLNGTMFFGGLNGLTVFKLDTKEKNTIVPNIVLTRLLLFNKEVFANDGNLILTNDIDDTQVLDLNYKQNVFSLEFSALHYSSPKDNEYAYKLNGFDKQWINTDSNNRRATYTNLDPGDYQFIIKASNNEGVWSQPVHKLNIHVHAAPWKTHFAYFIYFVLLSSTIGGFIWLRIKQMQAIKLRNEQLSLTSKLFENTSECVWLLDNDLKFLTVNNGFCDVSGFSEEETIGQKMSMVPVHGQDQKFVDEIFNTVINGGRWEGEMWAKRKNGEVYPIEIVIDKIELKNKGSENSLNQFVGVFSDITQRKKAEEDLKNMAYFDKLTQLPNRAYFHKLVHRATFEKSENEELLIFYFDLDDFKNINDSLGHSYGDQLLLIISKRLQDYANEAYTIARMGGDEFALMVPKSHIQSPFIEQSNQIGADIIRIIREQVKIKKHSLHVSASIGISVFPYDGKNYEELLRNADTAMYQAKTQGKNNFCLYSAQMNQAARKRLMLEDELNKAIEAHEIVPHYQPKVSLTTGKIEGLEILARWNHKELGWMPPIEFIPIAEESRLINRISDQLLTQSCLFLLPIIKSGHFKGRMSFNLSMTQFLQGDIVARIDTILKTCQFPSQYLEIEITESMVMKNINQAIEKMQQFQQRDINIAIDDFGTGYSSLSHLKKFPINTLKIDISFIRDILKSNEDRNIVISIIQLAHNLGLDVVAEGGESKDQVLVLKELGCEYLQGYFFSEALGSEEFLNLLISNKKFI